MTANRKFTEWKNKAMVLLLNLLREAEKDNNRKLAKDLRMLIGMLKDLRSRDLYSFLYYVHLTADLHNLKELLKIIPSEKEVEEMLS